MEVLYGMLGLFIVVGGVSLYALKQKKKLEKKQ